MFKISTGEKKWCAVILISSSRCCQLSIILHSYLFHCVPRYIVEQLKFSSVEIVHLCLLAE